MKRNLTYWLMRFFLPLAFFGTFVGYCSASSGIAPMSFLGQLLKGENAIGERLYSSWNNGTNGINGSDGQTLMFNSTGLPEVCKTGNRREDTVSVSLALTSDGRQAMVQVVGLVPRVLSDQCISKLLDDLRRAKPDGLQLVAGNLNQLNLGKRLFLEFSLHNPQFFQLEQTIHALESQATFGDKKQFIVFFMGRPWATSVLLLLLSLIGLILGYRLILANDSGK